VRFLKKKGHRFTPALFYPDRSACMTPISVRTKNIIADLGRDGLVGEVNLL
jgi:hypothetical protein